MGIQAYGMIKIGVISIDNPSMGRKHSSSAGLLVSGIESRIVKVDTMESLPPNQFGKIWVRGPSMMEGNLNEPEATKLTIDGEGWLRTGDLGYFDENGQLYVVDRIKDFIKCKGFRVAPAELEGLLLASPGILDVAVVLYPDDDAGEVPIAYVVKSPGSKVTEEGVRSFMAKQLISLSAAGGIIQKITYGNFFRKYSKVAFWKNSERAYTES